MNALHTTIVAALALAASSIAHADATLSAADLQQWYSGVTVDGVTETNATFRAYHSPDGTISALASGKYKNSGTWKVSEPGQVCVAWKDASWGANPCYTVSKDADDMWRIVRVDDPKMITKVKRIEGNAFGL